jgi:cytidylate kinase
MKKIIIAIDGPAAAGKSTVAKIIAKRINYIYIDSGAMYRAITLKALRNKLDIYDNDLISDLTKNSEITFIGDKVILDGEDVSHAIRKKLVDNNVSAVSALPGVREQLVILQQQFGVDKGVVMDGRDIGSVVFPHAELKVYLVASVEERALRRFNEIITKNPDQPQPDIKKIEETIRIRDEKDTSRAVSPLKITKDALQIDSSSLTTEEVADEILKYYYELVGK